ncbi:unnamed protein product [Linum tenue]|uniref:Uncharacterized protein n=1 Tax=Linum tenue TaxID=586396 RepID=A0AAV0K045_9ROSI|nr:unnamed protein product [Linum tenue]
MAGHSNNKPHLPVKPKPPPATTATVSVSGWFGCSNRNSVAIIKVAAAPPDHNHHIQKQKKHKPWFPNWSMKNPPATAAAAAAVSLTAPRDDSSSPAAESNSIKLGDHRKSTDSPKSKFIKWKPNCKASKKSHPTPAAVTEEKKVSTAAAEVAPPETPKESPKTGSSEENDVVLGNGSVWENRGDVESPKSGTCRKKLSFRRKKAENGDKTKTGSSSSNPGSPVSRPDPEARNDSVVISRSTTFPAPDLHQVQPIIVAAAGSRRNRKKEDGELDSVVGLSIIAVTLVIMVVWGRFCAIVCTAAWLYFVPRLRTTMAEVKVVKANHGRNRGSILRRADSEFGGSGLGTGSGRPDLDSVEYKRRVVLEGLLERNRRPVA